MTHRESKETIENVKAQKNIRKYETYRLACSVHLVNQTDTQVA